MNHEPIGEIVQAFADMTCVSIPVMPPVGTKLYAAPPQREWVGLTNEEILEIDESIDSSKYTLYAYTRAIEAKLKEKNT